ncbi:MAG: SurA N-terminal domain-containing protein, partial [Anaerolineae bacterium]|nr:SurA N-terminal domain-containing protein [Anaerolineae bacterium]
MARQEQSPVKGQNRKQQATHKRDEKAQRIITWIAIGVGVLVLLVLGYGVVSELIIKANAPVARIDDTAIKTKDYQARVRFERLSTQSQILQYENYLTQFDTTDETMQSFVEQLQQQKAQLQSQLSPGVATVFGGGVLEKMVEEHLVSEEAARLGIAVTQDEVDLQLEQLFGYDREAVVETTETVTDTVPPMTKEEFNTAFEQFKSTFLRQSGLSEAAFRRTLEVELLRPKVVEAAFPDIETTANQAQVTRLVTDTLEVATGWQQRLNEGESI